MRTVGRSVGLEEVRVVELSWMELRSELGAAQRRKVSEWDAFPLLSVRSSGTGGGMSGARRHDWQEAWSKRSKKTRRKAGRRRKGWAKRSMAGVNWEATEERVDGQSGGRPRVEWVSMS